MKSKIIPIAGDASFRKFYRLILKKNKILVLSKKEKYKNLVAHLAINKFLRKNKVLAPKFYLINYQKGMAIIEDFGNVSFYDVLSKRKNKFLNIGTQKSFNIFSKEVDWTDKGKFLQKFKEFLLKHKKKFILVFFLMIFALLFFIIK